MKKISSTRGPKIRKVLAILVPAITLIISIKENTYFILIPAAIFAAFAYFKKTQAVYIDKNDFVVKGKKILITDVISIRRKFRSSDFKVRYYDENDKIKSFTLEIDWLGLRLPDFMKQLIALAEKNNHDTPRLL